MTDRLILQLTGEARAGKSEVAKHLAEQHDFTVVLISDIIRAYAGIKELRLVNRDTYLSAFKSMKEEFGNEIVAEIILEASGDKLCIDGIRVPADAARLRQLGSKVIALDCPPEVRFERALLLQSSIDRLTFGEFIEDDARESSQRNPEYQVLDAVMGDADYRIDSARPLNEVLIDVDKVVAELTA